MGALRAAAEAADNAAARSAEAGAAAEVRGAEGRGSGAARSGMSEALRDVLLPGAVERLTKVSEGRPSRGCGREAQESLMVVGRTR